VPAASFPDLPALVRRLRRDIGHKRFVVIYAFNGTGKTRLSTAFKNQRRINRSGRRTARRHTLYFNAYTEDLFTWDNDLENDREYVLRINRSSRFFDGLEELEMDTRIRRFLHRYVDFDFTIDTSAWQVRFFRDERRLLANGTYVTQRADAIKVSRGEENIFIWCFFLAIVQLVLDGAEAYRWVKYVYVDDPISSLDEHHAVAVAHHLGQMLAGSERRTRFVVSSHHLLFFNVLSRDLGKDVRRYFLKRDAASGAYLLEDTSLTPIVSHLATLAELHELEASGKLYPYHFNAMRRIMEQTATFLGLTSWKDCVTPASGDPNDLLDTRMIDLLSHGDYAVFEPHEMLPENKAHFRTILRQFVEGHPFNRKLFTGPGGAP